MPPSAALWIAALLGIALAVPLGLFVVLRPAAQRARADELPSQWPLMPRPVFGSAERRLYRLLAEALPEHVILAKLPLVRLCQPASPEPAQVRYWFRLLGATHVSFAVCDAQGRVLAAVDLSSPRSRTSERTQRIKVAVLHACRVRYLNCTPDAMPSLPALRALVPPAQPDDPAARRRTPSASAATTAAPVAPVAPVAQDTGASSGFNDSFFAAPGDSVLGELTAAPDAARTRH